jgi:hypothetical protein
MHDCQQAENMVIKDSDGQATPELHFPNTHFSASQQFRPPDLRRRKRHARCAPFRADCGVRHFSLALD